MLDNPRVYKPTYALLALVPFLSSGGSFVDLLLGCERTAMQALFAMGVFAFTSVWVFLFHSLRKVVRGTPGWGHRSEPASELPVEPSSERESATTTTSLSSHRASIAEAKQRAMRNQKQVQQLLVRGCSKEYDNEKALSNVFETYGSVQGIKLRRRAHANGGSWAVVTMATPQEADEILKHTLPRPLVAERYSDEKARKSSGGMEAFCTALQRETHIEVTFSQNYFERTGVTEVGALSLETSDHGALAELSSCYGLCRDKFDKPWRHKVSPTVYSHMSRWGTATVVFSAVCLLSALLSFYGIYEFSFVNGFDRAQDSMISHIAPTGVFFPSDGCISNTAMKMYAVLLLAAYIPACILAGLVWPAWLLSLQLGAVSHVETRTVAVFLGH